MHHPNHSLCRVSPTPRSTNSTGRASASRSLSQESVKCLIHLRRGDISLIICKHNSQLYAYRDHCPACNMPLRLGAFESGVIVCSRGNLTDEPICIDESEAAEGLRGIADGFLVHDRPIVRHVDDSVVRVIRGRELVLRRARGYAPLPVHLKEPLPCLLALGAHLKNSVALSVGTEVFISHHIGDLSTNQAFQALRRASEDLLQLYEATPEVIACDMHPEYLSTKHARQLTACACRPASLGARPLLYGRK